MDCCDRPQPRQFKRTRGLTAADFAEFAALFERFDAARGGRLSARELRACLFSYGEEATQQQADAMVAEFGGGGGVTKAQFTQLMVHVRGVVDSRPVISAALRYLARDRETCPVTALAEVLPPDVVQVCGVGCGVHLTAAGHHQVRAGRCRRQHALRGVGRRHVLAMRWMYVLNDGLL